MFRYAKVMAMQEGQVT